jgi:hypothetical protein
MITENLSTLKIHKLTQEQYERELAAGNIDASALYLTPEEVIDHSIYATKQDLQDKADKNHNHDDKYVSNARTINGKALTSNITLSATDVGALPDTTIIPKTLSDLNSDTEHRTVTDSEKAIWDNKSEFSGDYNDLINKPEIPSTNGLATEVYVNNKIAEIPH